MGESRPHTNGRIERFHQTMGREWAYAPARRRISDRVEMVPPGFTARIEGSREHLFYLPKT